MSHVSNIARVFFAKLSDIFSLPANFAFGGRGKAADDSQQTGFTAAVRPAQFDEFAGPDCEVQSTKEPSIAAHAAQIHRFQHYSLSLSDRYAIHGQEKQSIGRCIIADTRAFVIKRGTRRKNLFRGR